MDPHRSAKRRKLDAVLNGSQESGSADRATTAADTQTNEAAGNQEQARAHNTIGDKPPLSTQEAWREAKARSQALRGKRPGHALNKEIPLSVYDDVEGAHASSPRFKQRTTPASTPQKQRLDPLRNQKSSPAVSSSPSKGAARLGFFKQFHQPKAKPASAGATSNAEATTQALSNGVTTIKKIDGLFSAKASEKLDDTRGLEPGDTTPQSSTRKPGWTYAIKPKRTFEDEINELANAARERAENGEEDETAASLSQKRRIKARIISADRETQDTPSKVRKRSAERELLDTPSKTRIAARPSDHSTSAVKVQKKENAKSGVVPAVQAPRHIDNEAEVEIDVAVPDQTPAKDQNSFQADGTDSTTPIKAKTKSDMKRPTWRKDMSFDPLSLRTIQRIVLDKLTCKRPIALANLDGEYSKVSTLITQTVTAGESNSMLLIGARGSGKSALVNQILQEQAKEHADDFLVVRLNGFIHTDDKIALREIWRQLGREMELDEDGSAMKSYADTLTTLLALLSHPAEQGLEQQDGQITKSVIFIIDEFELFASHPRQTLLYNLFDIAQSRKAPIAVLGLTTRIDVAESLEKRVKSRFSHRYVHLGMAKSFATFQDPCKAALALDNNDLTAQEREQLGSSTELKGKLEKASKAPEQSPFTDWNSFIDVLMAHDTFANHLRRLYYTSKSVPEFYTTMLLPISSMTTKEATTADDLLATLAASLTTSLSPPDSKLDILSALSTLHLAVLICAARLTTIHNVDTVPFVQAYEEYKMLASKAKLQASASGALAQGAASRVWSKDVARDAWEDLVSCGLLMEDGNRGCRVDVGLEEIGMSGVELGSWGRWCKQI